MEAAGAETIAAIATAAGRGGIGIVRLSGPEAVRIAGELVRLGGRALEHGRARFVRVRDPGAEDVVLDEGVVTAFLGPHSYTGEDVVELAVHGSPVVLEAVLAAALRGGARLAEPGEFTRRAFLSGRLDLTQAEAVGDLIAAQTLEGARAAARQLGGALSRRVRPAKERLVGLIALLEAGMDFASGELDDVEVVAPAVIAGEIAAVEGELEALARGARAGMLLREGVGMALVGRPNAGKSSLFNRLLERERAIVTAAPGTTRDTVEETWSLEGIPVRLVDTAGLRVAGEAAADEAERMGMERSREALADADVVLLVHDATGAMTGEERELARELAGRPHLVVWNKVDLAAADEGFGDEVGVRVSALTGEGLAGLRAAILEVLGAAGGVAEGGALSNRRQQESVRAALEALGAAAAANRAGLPHEVLLMDLHGALRGLDALTGETTAEEILGRIFAAFCIGK